jgi:hypothetical protein
VPGREGIDGLEPKRTAGARKQVEQGRDQRHGGKEEKVRMRESVA